VLAIPLGLAGIVWAPLLIGVGAVMWLVWLARRNRQSLERRSAEELKDPQHTSRRWPPGAVDDRLPRGDAE
jgi:hypothetical protein